MAEGLKTFSLIYLIYNYYSELNNIVYYNIQLQQLMSEYLLSIRFKYLSWVNDAIYT